MSVDVTFRVLLLVYWPVKIECYDWTEEETKHFFKYRENKQTRILSSHHLNTCTIVVVKD